MIRDDAAGVRAPDGWDAPPRPAHGLVWSLEWRVALRRRRLFALNVTIPLLLVLPVALAGAPPAHAAAVYAVLFVLFGTFGSAIPLVRDGERGFLARIRGSGIPPAAYLLERTAATSALDLAQLAPSLAAIVLLHGSGGTAPGTAGSGPDPALLVAASLAGALAVANLVGAWVAALARSVAEGALFAAVTALLLLHASGVFRTPDPGSLGARVEAVAPFGPLHEALLAAVGGAPAPAVGGSIAVLPAWVAIAAAVTALAAGPALRSLRGEP